MKEQLFGVRLVRELPEPPWQEKSRGGFMTSCCTAPCAIEKKSNDDIKTADLGRNAEIHYSLFLDCL